MIFLLKLFNVESTSVILLIRIISSTSSWNHCYQLEILFMTKSRKKVAIMVVDKKPHKQVTIIAFQIDNVGRIYSIQWTTEINNYFVLYV